MSESVGRDAPGASDKAVGARPATKRAVRIDTHTSVFSSTASIRFFAKSQSGGINDAQKASID